MDGKTYINTQMRLIEIGKIADTLDLESFLRCISNAEAVGPIMDPTMYMKAAENLAAIRKLAESVVQVKVAYEQTFKAVLNTAVHGFVKKSNP